MEKLLDTENVIEVNSTKKLTTAVIILGMAGSGKTTFVTVSLLINLIEIRRSAG